MNDVYEPVPSLSSIESGLFGVSSRLIEKVIAGDTSAAIAAAVRQSPEWAAYQSSRAESAADTGVAVPEVSMPPWLADLTARHVAARSALQDEQGRLPEPGQIVRIDDIQTPKPGQLDWVMQQPLYVLLDAPAESRELWHGWLCASEADYASCWDHVFQEDDGPIAPQAAMVQIWNPVRLWLPMAAEVCGRVRPDRLNAIRAMAGEYVSGQTPEQVPVRLGRIAARETLEGHWVVTGSALGNDQDPRRDYRHLYHHAAQAINEPARLCLKAIQAQQAAEQSHDNRWFGLWRLLFPELQAVPRVALAMDADAQTPEDLEVPGVVRLHLIESGPDDAELTLTALGDQPISCELLVDGHLARVLTLKPAAPAEELVWDKDCACSLRILLPSGEWMVLPLTLDD